MGFIRTLPPEVVNQIAAGEVVERPASVVKELVENAIDAGATRVAVRIAEGGKARIEVSDDGRGMDEEDLALAFLPHATSKLADVSDLEHIGSLGFRGEALASIGSVSRAAIVTRAREARAGSVVEDRRGDVTPVRPAAAPPGTLVSVEGLFADVPARRKFLRSAATEAGHVADAMARFALAYPEVSFSLETDGRAVLSCEAGEGRLARIARCHGDDLARALVVARSPGGDPAPAGHGLAVEAWISPPGHSRGDARLLQTYLNGRFIRDRTVAHAVREAYRDLVPPGHRHPVAFVFLSCDPARVDVNVHPTKAEVRWRDSSAVHETVRRVLRAALEAARPGVDVRLPAPAGRGVPTSTVAAAEFAFTNGVGRPAHAERVAEGAAGYGGGCSERHDHAPWDAPPTPAGAPRPAEALRPLGQALGTYLVLEADDGIVLVDQHALHERVLFDRISARLNETGRLEVQAMLVPAVVHLGGADAARVEEEKDLLATLGWHVDAFGDGAVAIHGCPAVLRRADPGEVFREVLSVLDGGRRDGLDRAALVSTVVDRMACRSAVMAGDALHPDEVLALLEQAERLNHAHSCPHGRPTRLRLSRRDLERHFHRVV
jgi:DNA mismatch repair protein MutL